MAEENEDQWLYGDSVEEKESLPKEPDLQTQEENVPFDNQEDSYSQNEQFDLNHKNLTDDAEKVLEDSRDGMNEENFETNSQLIKDDENLENQEETKENGTSENQNNQDDGEVNSDSESDDDVHVVIGDIKSTPAQYSTLNLKRGGLLSSGVVPDKLKQQPGKFSIDEFESIGSINGIPAHEYNLDTLEDKPWRQPGADITDYFNYGFNEETWRAYCERQKRMRSESGVGLILNTGNNTGAPATTGNPGLGRVPQVTITNYNSKYSGITGPKRAGPPPGRKMAGTIDVIGATGTASRRNLDKSPPKENVIQVMTADRREYSRKPPNPSFPDMSVPPPMPPPPPQVVPSIVPPAFDMPPPGYPEPAPYFMPEPDPYYNSYEPTQDRQWGNDPTWQPTNIANIPLTGSIMKESSKSLSAMIPPAMPMMPSDMRDRHHDRDRGRDRDRDYEMSSRDRERDRERDRGDRERDKESAMRDRDREESSAKDDDRDRERSRSVYKHKDRHRHRSRSRSRRHKSRSRSPSRRKKKSRRSDKEKSKEESE